ncbi:MAG: hypothetical protein JWN96_2962 [Mycobacterium sp.]|nr:hypothetical protein [Mycobacterium sp.]
MAGSTPCHTCGQVNGSDSEFCVRCGDKLPDPASTQVVSAPGAPQEYPWEPPAEWDPGELPPTAGQQQTWVGRNPDQVGWNTGNDTGAGGAGPAWGSQPGYTPTPTPPGPYQGYGGQQPPPGQPPQPARSGGSKKPLLIGGGAVVVIAIIVAVILIATGGKKDKNTSLNGVQTQTGTEALTSARVALRNAKSVRLTGTVKSDGQTIRLDLQLVGENSQGTLTINNNDVQLIKVGSTVYIKGDRDFLTKYANGNTAAVDALNGKWLKTAATSDFDEFSIAGFADQLKATSDVTVNDKTVQSTLNGKPVVVLSQSDGSKLSVANTGDPYPLFLDGKGDSPGQVTFAEYNKAVSITAPADAFDVDAAATPSPSPSPSASPTDDVRATLLGGYDCLIDGTTSTGGTLLLNDDGSYTVSDGVGGSWGSSGNQIAFSGGYLDKYTGTYDGDQTVHLRGAGTNANVTLTCTFQ